MSSPDKFEIFYIRHADTRSGTNDDRCKCDIDISPLGEKQIALLSERFKGKEFDAVFGDFAVEIEETGRKALKRLNFFVKFSFFSCSTVGTVV